MITTIATVAAGLLGAALIWLGTNAFIAPRAAAAFGIPAPVDHPDFLRWMQPKGVREIVPGIFIFVAMVTASPAVLGWYLLTFALIPAGDAAIVLRSGGPKHVAYGVHAATAAVMLAVGLVLLLA
ncbi:DUF4267 domain-containing protein [Nocardioides seonyuensis]|uniref:DUF4267 domain-containing protein n=1 Tax=Nocardioides seonyuensis TaxID=2518371 RepID=A0A4P7IL71_9ACTN|nr:DUF4267 domain-containing protein [Nocardioides seonyuensis]QBX57257.1 DUF4267 domain-containing protein [Nocardioides seonyuensis]